MRDIHGKRIHPLHLAGGMFLSVVAMDIYSEPWLTSTRVGRWIVVAGLVAIGLWHFRQSKRDDPTESVRPRRAGSDGP